MVAFVTLSLGIFRPILALIEERKTRTKGEKHLAENLEKKVLELTAEYEKRMENSRLKGMHKKEELRKAGEHFKEDLLNKARTEAEEQMKHLREEIDREFKNSQNQLKIETERIGHEIASTILERPV